MNLIQRAKDFLDKAKSFKRGEFISQFADLDEPLMEAVRDEQYARKRQEVVKSFDPSKAAKDKAREETSPSGRYRLVVTPFETGEGRWNYSQGEVFEGERLIATVQRNYGRFPFSWVESHPNGHDYLVCGEDYQGQTVVELDTGNRRDFMPSAGIAGYGFCWAAHNFEPSQQILVVDGCIWACPYEFRFYDFSDPMNGWSEIATDECIYAESKKPEFKDDGTILTFQEPYDEDDPEDERPEPVAIKTWKREGLKLILIEEWVADAEKERRVKAEEARQKYEQWLKDFRSSDPLYLKAKELMAEKPFNPETHEGIGITYKGWAPDFDKEERRICRRIVKRDDYDEPGWTVDLEWGHETGPIKLCLYKDGKSLDAKYFDHSVAGMEKAFSIARDLVTS